MIKRIKDYDKKAPSRNAHKVYIVCEGIETEQDYFEFFEGLSSNLQVEVIPPTKGTDPLKLMEHAKEVFIDDGRKYVLDFKQGDTVWFVIDTDTWETEGKIQPLRDFCAVENGKMLEGFDEVKPYKAWNVAQSNPCFEIWLYYHFFEDRPEDVDVEKFATFKEFVNRSISGGFHPQRDPVRLKDAIENSERNYTTDENGRPSLYSTEMHVLGRDIYNFVKKDLERLRNKLQA